jgi:hypothetical protein
MGPDGGAPERPQDETRGQKAQPPRKFHLLQSCHHCNSSSAVVVEAATLATQRPTKVKSTTLTSGSRYGMSGSAVLAVTSSCGGSASDHPAQRHLQAVGAARGRSAAQSGGLVPALDRPKTAGS